MIVRVGVQLPLGAGIDPLKVVFRHEASVGWDELRDLGVQETLAVFPALHRQGRVRAEVQLTV